MEVLSEFKRGPSIHRPESRADCFLHSEAHRCDGRVAVKQEAFTTAAASELVIRSSGCGLQGRRIANWSWIQ